VSDGITDDILAYSVWHMTPDEVNHSQAGNVFMLGAGGIFSKLS